MGFQWNLSFVFGLMTLLKLYPIYTFSAAVNKNSHLFLQQKYSDLNHFFKDTHARD